MNETRELWDFRNDQDYELITSRDDIKNLPIPDDFKQCGFALIKYDYREYEYTEIWICNENSSTWMYANLVRMK